MFNLYKFNLKIIIQMNNKLADISIINQNQMDIRLMIKKIDNKKNKLTQSVQINNLFLIFIRSI